MTDVAEIAALSHGRKVMELVVRIVKVQKPWPQTDLDKEYGWHRQTILVEGGDGQKITLQGNSPSMHLGSKNEGQVWRFRCLPGEDDGVPKGLEIRKWSKAGSKEINVEVKMDSRADASRLAWLEEAAAQVIPDEKIQTIIPDPMPEKDPLPVLDTDIEELVRADIARRRDFGRAKYGKSMERDDLTLRDWLQHRYEEILDDALYTRRAIRDIDDGNLILICKIDYDILVADATDIREGKTVILSQEEFDKLQVATQRGGIDREDLVHESAATGHTTPIRAAPELVASKPEDDAPWGDTNPFPEGMSAVPCEKPQRSNVEGNPPPQAEQPKPREMSPAPPKREPEPKKEMVKDMTDKATRLKHFAANIRYAWDEDATEIQISTAHACLLMMKKSGDTWGEILLALTAKTRHENLPVYEEALALFTDGINTRYAELKKPNPTEEMVAEMIIKKPSIFRQMITQAEGMVNQ